MHRVLSAKTANLTRQVDDRGDMISRTKEELEKLPFSSRTPRVTQRAKTQLSNAKPKTKTITALQSSRSRSKISTNYSDPRQQAKDLMQEGIHCTATNQKHEIITQLGNLLLQQIIQTEIYQNDLHRQEAKNLELENEIQSLKSLNDKIQNNSARILKLKYFKTLKSDSALIEDIRTIENDIQKYANLSEPWLLQDIIDSNADEKIVEYINLKFRRLEDLIYVLRKHILEDQDISSILPVINKRFGSFRNLLTQYEDSQSQIEKFKVREFRLSSDELTKRRPLAQYDIQSLHTLIIALQNELVDAKTQLRGSLLVGKHTKSQQFHQENVEQQIDFDLISKYNSLEANYSELQRSFEQIKKDNDLLQAETNMDSESLKTGLFAVDDKLKAKLINANERLNEYYNKLEKMQNTIDLQQQLVVQFQKEKAVYLKQKIQLNSEVQELKEKILQSEAKVRTVERKLEAVRGIARIMAENTLSSHKEYNRTFDQIENVFYHKFEKLDSAALLIQRCWRKLKNPEHEKRVIKKDMMFPLTSIMTTSSIDVIAGKMKPVAYSQIVKLLTSYNSEIKQYSMAQFALMKQYLETTHENMNMVSENVLCKPKRFNWTQTSPNHFEVETQTEKMPARGKK